MSLRPRTAVAVPLILCGLFRNRDGISITIEEAPFVGVGVQMQGVLCSVDRAGGCPDLDEMVPGLQATGDDLLVAKHFAVGDGRFQVSVRGRANPPRFRPQASGQRLPLPLAQGQSQRSFHRKTPIA